MGFPPLLATQFTMTPSSLGDSKALLLRNSTPRHVKSISGDTILKLAGKILLFVAAIYGVILVALYVIISLPPGRFANIIARIPSSETPGGPLFEYVLPLEPIFKSARAGKLRVGDPAPTFDLKLVHGAERVQLDSFRAG